MVANAALLGFLIPKLPEICPPTSWENIIIPFVYSIAGLLLSFLWRLGLKKSAEWIDHWRCLLKKLEAKAWGEKFNVFPKNKKIGAIRNSYHVVWLFIAFWIILIFYFIIAICVKCHLRQLCVNCNLCPLISILLTLGLVLLALGVIFRKKLGVFIRKRFRNEPTN